MVAAFDTAATARTARLPGEPTCRAPPATSPIYAFTQERVAPTPSGPIGYYRFGHGSPLVLVTGFRSTLAEWDAAFLAELAQHHDVVFDDRGIGRSIPDATSFTVGEMAGDTAALIDALKLHQPLVLGWSMGGAIVQQLAIDHPDALRGIVLMSTFVPGPTGVPVPPDILRRLSGAPGVTFPQIMAALFPAPDVAEAVRCFRREMFQPHGYGRAAIPEAVTAGQTALLADWSDDAAAASLAHVRTPALVIAGAADAVASVRNADSLRHLLPNARLLTIAGAGHAMMYQYPAKLARAIATFGRQLGGALK